MKQGDFTVSCRARSLAAFDNMLARPGSIPTVPRAPKVAENSRSNNLTSDAEYRPNSLSDDQPDRETLRARGVVEVVRVQRVQNDKFMNFGPAEIP